MRKHSAKMRFTIARLGGQCRECSCRYRAGEVVVLGRRSAFHSDCFRTRGSLELLAYEDHQPHELDRLLAVIQAEDIVRAR